MRRSRSVGIALGVLMSLSVGLTAVAHEGSGEETLEVEPSTITAGDTVVLAGSGLEPDDERILVLAGEGLTLDLGTVATDAEGMFSLELPIPDHLPSGNYELRAIGDETLTTSLGVTASAAGAGASPAANEANETVVARARTPVEIGVILAFVLVAAAVGGWLVWRAERFRGTQTA